MKFGYAVGNSVTGNGPCISNQNAFPRRHRDMDGVAIPFLHPNANVAAFRALCVARKGMKHASRIEKSVVSQAVCILGFDISRWDSVCQGLWSRNDPKACCRAGADATHASRSAVRGDSAGKGRERVPRVAMRRLFTGEPTNFEPWWEEAAIRPLNVGLQPLKMELNPSFWGHFLFSASQHVARSGAARRWIPSWRRPGIRSQGFRGIQVPRHQ